MIKQDLYFSSQLSNIIENKKKSFSLISLLFIFILKKKKSKAVFALIFNYDEIILRDLFTFTVLWKVFIKSSYYRPSFERSTRRIEILEVLGKVLVSFVERWRNLIYLISVYKVFEMDHLFHGEVNGV